MDRPRTNTLHLMDCMDGMAAFPDKFFDLAIVDPPYGGGGVGTDDAFKGKRGRFGGRFDRYFDDQAGGGRFDRYTSESRTHGRDMGCEVLGRSGYV